MDRRINKMIKDLQEEIIHNIFNTFENTQGKIIHKIILKETNND